MTRKEILKKVRKDPFYLEYVENQDESMCLIALKLNPFSLKYVKNQTEKICLEAVKQEGMALQFVKNKTPQICLKALKNEPKLYRSVRIVPNPDFETTLQNLKKKQFILEALND